MKKREISAQIITDSISERGDRLTTFILIFPRIVLAELNTHRVFSRNSASSRAIPFKKMLHSVWTDPFIPIAFMRDHSGMQGSEYFTGFRVKLLKFLWLSARNFAVIFAWLLSKLGLTKQIVNRLLEPFLWHQVIVTASEFENFFALRAHDAAEIHIRDLAYKMLDAYNKSKPTLKREPEWHIPFGDKVNDMKVHKILSKKFGTRMQDGSNDPVLQPEYANAYQDILLKIASARCARVSYNNFDGSDDYEKDIQLYDRLASMGHWSPMEHCAHPTEIGTFSGGNFRGWTQLRHTKGNWKTENRQDSRVIKHNPRNL